MDTLHTSRRDKDIGRSKSACTSRRCHFFGENDLANLVEVGVGENEANVTLDVW